MLSQDLRPRYRSAICLLVCALAAPTVTGQPLCGDCDVDTRITILDALAGAHISAGIFMPTMTQMMTCDVNDSTTITIGDALSIAQFVVGLPVSLMCPAGPMGGSKLYVNVGNAVQIIDLATNMSLGTVPSAGVGQGIAIDSTGSFVYASFSGNLIEIDTSTDTISRTFPLSLTSARKVAVSGNFAYVALFVSPGNATVDRINLTTAVRTSLTVPPAAWEVTANLAGTQLYVGHIGIADMITRIDIGTFTVALSTPLSNDPISIEENPATGRIYVGCRDANPDVSGLSDLHERDAMTLANVQTFAVDDAFGMAVTTSGAALYVCSNHNAGAPIPPYFVKKVDLLTSMVTATMIPVGNQPWYFALDAVSGDLFTCDNASNQITRIDTSTDTVVTTIALTASPRDAVVR